MSATPRRKSAKTRPFPPPPVYQFTNHGDGSCSLSLRAIIKTEMGLEIMRLIADAKPAKEQRRG